MIHGLTSEWGSIITSVADGTQPTTTYGTSVTPGTSNNYGNYASVLSGSSLTADACAIEVIVTAAHSNAVDRSMLVTIGFDPAGGTTFSGLGGVTGNEINNLLCSGAFDWWSGANTMSQCRFYFPIFVKSGTTIGAKAQTNDSTAGSVRVAVVCYCKPSRPDAIRAGSFVRTFGITTASTVGTAVTQGTASEGSWTEIGTSADSLWYLEAMTGVHGASQVAAASLSDMAIGDASNKRVVIRDVAVATSTIDFQIRQGMTGAYCDIASGDKIYGRSQTSAAQAGFTMAAYAVGG